MVCYIGFICKFVCCEGVDFFFKSLVCVLDFKCKLEQKFGQYGVIVCKGKLFDYVIQLCEKQKVKCIYGLLECQFCNYYKKVLIKKGNIGENLLQLLEICLDNVVYCMGFVVICLVVCQLVLYCGVIVNGKLVNLVLYQVKVGDVVVLFEKVVKQLCVQEVLIVVVQYDLCLLWVEVDFGKFVGIFKVVLDCVDLFVDINEVLIVELYLK